MTSAMMERPMVMDGVEGMVKDEVLSLIEEKLAAFDEAIEGHEYLEIDGDIEGDNPQEHFLKIINHKLETAFSISMDAVIRQELGYVVNALETGVVTRLYGVTRIVGYYSRITNWNKSKIGELNDRHMGKYSVR